MEKIFLFVFFGLALIAIFSWTFLASKRSESEKRTIYEILCLVFAAVFLVAFLIFVLINDKLGLIMAIIFLSVTFVGVPLTSFLITKFLKK